MSDSDSFISEVTEEVRRERLYRTLRRYAWLIAAVIILIVGGAAFNEWRLARDRAAAEAVGDSLRAALETADPAERAAALAALEPGSAAALTQIAEAGALLEADDRTGAAALLEEVAAAGETPEPYRSLASLQRVMILGPDLAESERLGALDALAADGAPYRLLALEERALLRLETGDRAAAMADLETIVAAPAAPEGLRGRAQQLIVAAGGALPSAAPEADAVSGG